MGHVAHNEEESDITRFYTDPETAKQFVSETGVDALAVAVRTAHGFYRGKVRIDFDRLSRIRDSVGEAALVLHGGTGALASVTNSSREQLIAASQRSTSGPNLRMHSRGP